MNPLQLDGVTKHFDDFTLDVTLTVPRGFVMGLVGANGSGKTTTIKCALGLTRPDSGTVHLIEKERIGIVLDQPAYVGGWTAREVGQILAPFYGAWNHERFESMLASAGIAPAKKVKDLSRGMSMRLQVAVALSHDAEFLILDEPTSGLDPRARDEFTALLADFMTDENHSVLFSTHITSDLDKIADYVTVLSDGQVISSSTKDDLVDDYRLVRGAPGCLPADVRPLISGLREHSAGWDGLIRTEDTTTLGKDAVADAPSLDDIVIRLAKESHHV